MKSSSKKNVSQNTKEVDEEERIRQEDKNRTKEEETRRKREELRELSARKVSQREAAEEGKNNINNILIYF